LDLAPPQIIRKMKKIKSIIFMLLLLVLLLIVYLVASPMWSEDTPEDTSGEETFAVATIDHTLLVGLELTHGESSLSFTLNDKATEWNWSENGEVPLDNMAFANVVTAINNAKSKYKLEGTTAEQLEEYGLSNPSMKVKFSFSDGSAKEYFFGNINSFNGLYYLSEAGAPNTVYMVDAAVKTALELEIYDFVLEETPPAITEAKIKQVDYLPANDEFITTFSYYPSGKGGEYTDRYEWYYSIQHIAMSSLPIGNPIDGDVADTLADLVTGLSFEECVGLDYTTGDYGFSEQNRITISYEAAEGETDVLQKKEYVIWLGSQTEDGKLYAHTADSKLVYLLGSSDEWISVLDATRAKLLPDEVWLPNYEFVDSMTFTVGTNTLAVNVKTADGKTSFTSSASDDAEAISALVKALENLTAKSNVEYFSDDASLVEPAEMFTVEIAFNAGDAPKLDMIIEKYSQNYCLVNFNGRADQLVTLEDVQAIIDMITSFCTKAA
jgi:hypothetical protein